MAQQGDDCYFFYYQSCIKGSACPFRHVEEARGNEITCEDWLRHQCHTVPCPYRHMELQKSAPCYFERQPGGCTKPNCQYLHKFGNKSRSQQPVMTTTTPTVTTNSVPPSIPTGPAQSIPPPHSSYPGPTNWNRPPPVWPAAHLPPPPAAQMFPGPPDPLAPGFRPLHPPNVPLPKPPFFPPPIEPVIINPNEESSDQDSIKGSPMKSSRMVVPSSSSTQSSNPLDYFLNAKPWVDPREQRERAESPGRTSPYRKQESPSPRRSLSPDNISRRRSASAERYSGNTRRRSSSMDRSRSPDWRDRRRFGRRSSRSPPRRRSRSPYRDGRNRDRGLMNKFKVGPRSGPKLEEVKVTGSKIISIKKDDAGSGKEKTEEPAEDKSKVKESESSVVEDEVKSLEEIYRERALMSMMEAKRKKILENKRKRWEKVDSSKKSESESDTGKQSVDEKGDNTENTNETSSDNNDEEDEVKSEVDLADDIDIELGEGDLESDNDDKINEDSAEHSEGSTKGRSDKPVRSSTVEQKKSKPSIKSRLGLKAVNEIKEQAQVLRPERNTLKRSIKDRLGLKSTVEADKPVRSGVIKLNRSSKAEDIMSRIRSNRRVNDNKSVLMLPRITIKNEPDIEQRKAGIKQRLGLLDENDDSKRDRKKRSIDDELMKLLNEEGADISEDDLDLLSKKEKKKLLKRLLIQQGREEEYEALRRKKKKGLRKKKEYYSDDEDDENGDGDTRRRIKLRDRQDDKTPKADLEDDDTCDIPSEEEICLGEEIQHEEEEDHEETEELETTDAVKQTSQVKQKVKSPEEIQREKEAKEAKLREALEPKSIEDIRKERAVKRAQGGDLVTRIVGNKRKIIIEEEPVSKPVDPPVRVTFNSEDSVSSRKLIRLGRLGEQNENDQPSRSNVGRASKQERKIYVPPTIKKLGASTVSSKVTKQVVPPKGREIIDYGDMFPKLSTSAQDVSERKAPVKLTVSASDSDVTMKRKLTAKPPKVEIKNAEVKTFAEIMAEKKRKRQLAQQGKSYTPVTFDELDSTQSQEKKSTIVDRLSPTITSNVSDKINMNIPSSSPDKTLTVQSSVSSSNNENLNSKPTRWKRRKVGNTDTGTVTSDTQASITFDTVDSSAKPKTVTLPTSVVKSLPVINTAPVSTVKSSPAVKPIPGSTVKTSPGTKSAQKTSSVSSSIQEKSETKVSEPSPTEKKKLSDSLLEFDDDLLDMDDDDLDLDLDVEQDHDALMREMDELLS
ncbi:hypothetical protein ACF0H5_015699 [Mactra antiquata]